MFPILVSSYFQLLLADTLIKKKIKFSSYIRNFIMKQLQSHIWLTAPHMWENICAFSHILGSPSPYVTLQLLHSEFPYTVYEENFSVHIKAELWSEVPQLGFQEYIFWRLVRCALYAKTYPKVKKKTQNSRRSLFMLTSLWSATSLFPAQEPVLRDRHTPGGQPETGTRGRGFHSFKMAAAHLVWKIYIFMKPGYKTAMKIKLNFYN